MDDPSSIPVDDCARRLHGVDELSELVEMYGTDKTENQCTYPAIIDGRKAKHEWDMFKDDWSTRGMLGKGIETDSDALQVILTSDVFKRLYPNILLLIVIKLILWLQTAECERGFSLRTLLKTKQRDILMMFCCNGPAIDDIIAVPALIGAAMQQFKEARDRFPSRSGVGVSRRKKDKGAALG